MSKIKFLLLDNEIEYYKKDSELIFFDEYSKNLYNENSLKKFKTSYLTKYHNLKKFNFYSFLLKKKLIKYRIELANNLNKIHNKSYDIKFWGLLIDRILFVILNSIILERQNLLKIRKKSEVKILRLKKLQKFYDSLEFENSLENNQTQAYIRYVLAKSLGIKVDNKLTLKSKVLQNNKEKKLLKISKYNLIFKYVLKIYCKFFNPILLIDSYISKKQSILIFFKSFGRILSIPSKFIFIKKNFKRKFNINLRKKILIKEKNLFDKNFNSLIYNLLPLSFVENFSYYEKQIKPFKKLKRIGSAVGLIRNDFYKLLAANINFKKGIIYSFQHGGLIGLHRRDIDYENIFSKKYTSKVYDWKNNGNFKENFFSNLDTKKNSVNEFKDSILIYPTRIKTKYMYNQNVYKKNHPNLNLNYFFYNNLNNQLKKKTFIKLFPDINSEIVKKNWYQKFGKSVKFINTISNKSQTLKNFNLIIIDDVSTPICEILYLRLPFILIIDELDWLSNKIKKKLVALKSLNIYFENPHQASIFINRNYNNLEQWWEKNLKNKIFNDFLKELIPINKSKKSIINLI